MRNIFFPLALGLSVCFLLLLPLILIDSGNFETLAFIFNPFHGLLGVGFAAGFAVFSFTIVLLYDTIDEERKQTVYGLLGKVLSVSAIILFLLYVMGMSSQILFSEYGNEKVALMIGKLLLWGAFFFIVNIVLLFALEGINYLRKVGAPAGI